MSYLLIFATLLFVLFAILQGFRYFIVTLWVVLIISAWSMIQMRLATAIIPWNLAVIFALSISLPLFIFSLRFTGGNLSIFWENYSTLKFCIGWDRLGTQSLTAFGEELAWRVVIQGVFIYLYGIIVGVVLATFGFWLAHRKCFPLWSKVSLDALLFSLFLAIVFEITHNFLLVFLLHTIRNVLAISYQSLSRQVIL